MTTLVDASITTLTAQLCDLVALLTHDDQIQALNMIRRQLHAISPFADQPVDCVQWIPIADVVDNTYNPNHIASPEMKLLTQSILDDGFTQPIVGAYDDPALPTVTVVDGAHRRKQIAQNQRVRRSVDGYAPVVLIRPQQNRVAGRIAATIRHNRARGVHGVVPMAQIVQQLVANGEKLDSIADALGMDADEALRLSQLSGIASQFAGGSFSPAWE